MAAEAPKPAASVSDPKFEELIAEFSSRVLSHYGDGVASFKVEIKHVDGKKASSKKVFKEVAKSASSSDSDSDGEKKDKKKDKKKESK